MVCLGRKFGVAAQTNPLSYGDPPPKFFIVVPIPISFVSPKHVRVELWLREKIENKKIANVHSLFPNLMVRL